ncbi:MAG TPA: 3-oxoacyl-ACP synthase [Microscillaceae bacterium]|nr:3-oxoacyl-ACP synthase [Microscillaceae bacterium]
MTKIRAAITGVQGYVPDYVLTNEELSTMVDTTDEWIMTRTGIKERRILKGEGLGTSFMGAKAVQGLLEKTNTDPMDIDLLICSTTTPDMVFPATANLIANEVGAKKAFNYDMQAACSGFLYALYTAAQFIETGAYKKIVVVGADKMSSIIDYTDRTTCVIFGDGAGAVLLEPDQEGFGIQDAVMQSDGAGWVHLHQKAGGSRRPPTAETVQNREHFVYQEGKHVFKHAVENMGAVVLDVMKRNDLTADTIHWLNPHQANRRIVDATAKRMGLDTGVDSEKVMMTIHKYGNTTNGTIPLNLWNYEPQLKKGDNTILAAFGGGFTWGAIYLKWAYDGK